MSYQTGRLDRNAVFTDPSIKDPDNLPIPLGWNILVRPYPVKQKQTTKIILPDDELVFQGSTANVARVVAIGPCCYNKPEQRDRNGNQFDWIQVGDFVTYARHAGAKRNFKGVVYTLLTDDEVVERLEDPQVFNEGFFELNIPEEDLVKYNTIYNPNYNTLERTY